MNHTYISPQELIAKRLMRDDALVCERLFSYLGELEGRIAELETKTGGATNKQR